MLEGGSSDSGLASRSDLPYLTPMTFRLGLTVVKACDQAGRALTSKMNIEAQDGLWDGRCDGQ